MEPLKKEESAYFQYERKPLSPLKAKLIFWATLVGGIALGTMLFLFFLAFFVYVIAPLLAVFLIWGAFKYWQYRRSFRRW